MRFELTEPQIGLYSREEIEKLNTARVAIPGMGGVGGTHLITLVRTGVGRFNVADFDTFEVRNLSRQYARFDEVGRNKAGVLAAEARRIRPDVQIHVFEEGVHEGNIDAFLEDVDVVVDGIEFFALDARRLLYDKAREKGIPLVVAAPLGFTAALLVFDWRVSPSFEEYFDIRPDTPKEDALIKLALGFSPRAWCLKYLDPRTLDVGRNRGPASVFTCYACSALAGLEAVKIILGRPGIRPVPHYFQFDLYLHRAHTGKLRWGNRGPLQRLKFHLVRRVLFSGEGLV